MLTVRGLSPVPGDNPRGLLHHWHHVGLEFSPALFLMTWLEAHVNDKSMHDTFSYRIGYEAPS